MWKFADRFFVGLHDETIIHPRFTSPQGFYTIGEALGHFLAEQLNYRGHFLCLGETGQRITGFIEALGRYTPDITVTCHPCSGYGDHRLQTDQVNISQNSIVLPNAIFGQSDPIALAACDVVAEMRLSDYARS